MKTQDMLRVCLNCSLVAKGGTDDWREPNAADLVHPAQSHGFCCEGCINEMYPMDDEGEADCAA